MKREQQVVPRAGHYEPRRNYADLGEMALIYYKRAATSVLSLETFGIRCFNDYWLQYSPTATHPGVSRTIVRIEIQDLVQLNASRHMHVLNYQTHRYSTCILHTSQQRGLLGYCMASHANA